MKDSWLPDSLAELEHRLHGLPREATAAGLRERVLNAVGSELAHRPNPQPRPGWPWAAIAAGVLILLNLSAIWSTQDQFRPGPASDGGSARMEIYLLRAAEAQMPGVLR